MAVKIFNINPSNLVIPKIITDNYGSTSKAKSFYSSRMALKQCLEETYHYQIIDLVSDLKINNHHHLKKYPNILVSLTHSKSFGAAMIEDSKDFLSIGLDLELSNRKILFDIKKYFINSMDKISIYSSLLHIWSAKEAIFKAIDPVINLLAPNFLDNRNHFILKNIILIEENFYLDNSKFNILRPLGTVEISEISVNENQLILAKAFIKDA